MWTPEPIVRRQRREGVASRVSRLWQRVFAEVRPAAERRTGVRHVDSGAVRGEHDRLGARGPQPDLRAGWIELDEPDGPAVALEPDVRVARLIEDCLGGASDDVAGVDGEVGELLPRAV